MSTNTTELHSPSSQTTTHTISFSILPSPPSTTTILLLLTTYLLAVRYLRYSRRDFMVKKLGYTTRESLRSMTNADAQKILGYVGELEFPTFYKMSAQFALFKTYGIPSISRLLEETHQFTSASTASKRYADTSILIAECTSHPPLHPRVLKAIVRINYLHAPYQKAGKISNNDLLYTLSVFIREPISWIQEYEWRPLNDMEMCALGTYWKGIGDAMKISYDPLLQRPENHPHPGPAAPWRDGLDFYTDINAWAQRYERQQMRPGVRSCKKTADALVPLLIHSVPRFLRPFARDAIGVIMGPQLRAAMAHEEPSLTHTLLTTTLLNVRKWMIRYASLPRPAWMRVREVSGTEEAPGEDGRFPAMTYLAHPYYVRPGVWNRWGPMALLTRALGGYVPEVEGEQATEWKAKGYKIEEVGPVRKEGKGMQEMEEMEEEIMKERTMGCPFAFVG
ncbi:hypothetical protein DSL72_003068 [Monilinia vaccinii-corymbosi]|uniref:ER-bound oxygenase mpaB/mpaB'/Rubber oxygenase catalytic domain-containing protein n=1 Tax=Monilinia vaccinii-corymbosi TaxID=61207 RepID=A0A8A3NX14_9HELO|nr:hypothetical protein DSL72_003068 [Monilinia vaccinii-corymbosi]